MMTQSVKEHRLIEVGRNRKERQNPVGKEEMVMVKLIGRSLSQERKRMKMDID